MGGHCIITKILPDGVAGQGDLGKVGLGQRRQNRMEELS